MQLAMFMALFANAHRNPKKAGQFKVSTFLPEWLRPRRVQQSWQSIKEKMMGLTKAMNGLIESGGEKVTAVPDGSGERKHRD